MKIVTHNDRFHADDVFATAVMQIIYGKDVEVMRTRDMDVINSADIVYDVGGIYNEENNRFDHHQQEFNEVRENGIPYAAFGLVWKKWGEEVCGSRLAADVVDHKLVQVIDAGDNGFSTHEKKHEDYTIYSVDWMIKAFGPSWKEDKGFDYDTPFFKAVDFVRPILEREIKLAQDKVEAIPIVEKAYEDAEDKRLIIFDRFVPRGDVLNNHPEPAFVISPEPDSNKWRMVAIQEDNFVNRIDPPMEWRGLSNERLQEVSGVPDAVFCHKSGFLTVAGSFEGIMKMAEITLNQ